MKKSNFFLFLEKPNVEFFWNIILIKSIGENGNGIKDEEYDINANYQVYFSNTKLTTKHMDDEDKSTVFNILEKIGFYSMTHN